MKLTISEKIFIYLLLSILLIVLLSFIYKINEDNLTKIPRRGGNISEGIVGYPFFVNPVFAKTSQEKDVVSLVFSGLTKEIEDGEIIGDIAKEWTISEDGTRYIFTLRDDIYFDNGKSITAEDVEFTINTIKDDDVDSYLYQDWKDISVKAKGKNIIIFELPQKSVIFLNMTTIGVIPKQSWSKVKPEEMKFHWLNKNPTGSGAYRVDSFETTSDGTVNLYNLKINNLYPKKPLIEEIVLKFYKDEGDLIKAFNNKKVENISGVTQSSLDTINLGNSKIYKFKTSRVFGIFFNPSFKNILEDDVIRAVLIECIDRTKLEEVFNNYINIIDGPLPIHETKKGNCDIEKIKIILNDTGWRYSEKSNTYKKEDKELSFTITTLDSKEFIKAAEEVKKQWNSIGFRVNIDLVSLEDIKENIIPTGSFTALLFGYEVGSKYDVFDTWHTDGTNKIIDFENIVVDKIIERIRDVEGDKTRKILYNELKSSIAKDSLVVFLYSPDFIYIANSDINGIDSDRAPLLNLSDRYSNINEWYVFEEKVWDLFLDKS